MNIHKAYPDTQTEVRITMTGHVQQSFKSINTNLSADNRIRVLNISERHKTIQRGNLKEICV